MNSFRVMVVDDDAVSAGLLERTLIKTFKTLHCMSGEDFRQQVFSFQPEIILMDIQLGASTTGFELTEWYRVQNGKAQVIFISSFDTAEVLGRVYSCGGNDYILKPVSPYILHEKLDLAVTWTLSDSTH